MSAVGTLNEAERDALEQDAGGLGRKALSIIDAQAEINAAMSAQIAAIKFDHAADRAALVDAASYAANSVASLASAEARVLELEAQKTDLVHPIGAVEERVQLPATGHEGPPVFEYRYRLPTAAEVEASKAIVRASQPPAADANEVLWLDEGAD